MLSLKSNGQINLNTKTISSEILIKVNNLRDSASLKPLKQNKTLEKAAIDQSDYLQYTKKLSHSQVTLNKQNPSERVFYYGGNYNYIGENVAYVSLKTTGGKIKSEEKIAEDLYQAWLHSPPHKENMLGKNYYQIGIGFAVDTILNRVYGTQVFSALGYRFANKVKTPAKAYGVQTYDTSACEGMKNFKYGTLSLANGLYMKGDSVFIKYHDLDYFNRLIPDMNDGYALDIVFRDQMPCKSPNLFHGSEIFDGYMLEPVFRYELLKSNSSKNPRKVIAFIARVPQNIKQHELNLILIRDNHQCDYSYPVHVPADDIPPFHVEPKFLDSSYTFNPIKIDTSIDLTFSFERGSTEWNEHYSFNLYNTLYGYSQFVTEMDIETFSSVEGKEWLNIDLQEKRSEKIKMLLSQFINEETSVSENIQENWPKFEEQIKELSLTQFDGLDEKGIKRELLKEKGNPLFDSLLFEQRIARTHLKIKGRIDSITTGLNEYLAIKYTSKQMRNALMAHLLFESNGEARHSVMQEVDSTSFFSNHLANNIYAANAQQKYKIFPPFSPTPNLDNLNANDSVSSYLALNWINIYFHVLYQKSRQYYYNPEEMNLPIKPDEALEAIQKLETDGFQDTVMLSKLKLNYALSSIQYYSATNQWSRSTHLFKIIFDYFYSANLSIEELTDLALFCNWYHKYDKTVEMLGHAYDENYLDENAAFVLAQTATLIYTELDQETYLGYMQTAYDANPKRWCTWLNTNFQVNRNEDVKKIFCEKCQ